MNEPNDTEPKYTLAQAQAELARRECAENGHAPSQSLHVLASRVAIRWTCECGHVSWVPEP